MAEQVGAIEAVISADIKGFRKSIKTASKSLEDFGKRADKIGREMSLKLTTPILGLGTAAVMSAGKFEKLRTSLNVLTGSAEEGSKAFERLVKFSAGTPFQLDELVRANNTLLGFGMSSDAAYKALRNIGDIAAVSGGDLKGISVAFGQVAASGRLMGQDLLQLINNGVPIIDMLASSMGVATSEVKDLVSEGAVTFPVLVKAFEDATKAGGQFAGGMELQSKTIFGLFSTLKDNVNIALAEIGNSLAENLDLAKVVTDLTAYVQRLTASFKQLTPEAQKTIIAIAGVVAAVGPALIIIGKISIGLAALSGLFAALSGPIGIAIVAVGALTAALFKFRDISRGGEESLKMIADATDVVRGAYDRLNSAQSDINDILKDSTRYTKEQVAAKKAEAQATLLAADAALKEAKAKRQVIIEQLKEEMQRGQKIGAMPGFLGILQMSFQKGKFDEVGAELTNLLQVEKGAEAQSNALAEALYNLENATLEYGTGLENTNKKCKENTTLLEKQAKAASALADENAGLTMGSFTGFDSMGDPFKNTRTGASTFLDLMGPLRDRITEAKSSLTELQTRGEIFGDSAQQIAGTQLGFLRSEVERMRDAGITSGAYYDFIIAKLKETQNSYDVLGAAAQQSAQSVISAIGSIIGAMRGLAGDSKALALFEIAANTARGIASAVAAGAGIPFPGNLAAIATGITSVLGGIAQAKSALSSAPAFAEGGMVTGPTLAMVGDNASGKEAIIPFEKMGSFMNMVGGSNVNVNITGEFDGDALRLVLDKSSKDLNNLR